MKTTTQNTLKELIDSEIKKLKKGLYHTIEMSNKRSPGASTNQYSSVLDDLRFMLLNLDNVFKQ